jgi:hypothetical protein
MNPFFVPGRGLLLIAKERIDEIQAHLDLVAAPLFF